VNDSGEMVLMKNNVFQTENGIDLFIYGTLLPGCRLEQKKLSAVHEEAQYS